MPELQRISPCLWFDDQAEEAARFYTQVFKNSRIVSTTRYGKTGFEMHGKPAGSVAVVDFILDGQPFAALNGGPNFKFTEAVSLQILCDDQKEIDYYWAMLSDGGEPSVCGWVKDRYGLSWQVVPREMSELYEHPGSDAAERTWAAMLSMKKLDIAQLRRAHDGEERQARSRAS